MPTLATRINRFFDNRPDPESKALAINPMPRRSIEELRATTEPLRNNAYVALALDTIVDHAVSANYGVYTMQDGQRLQVTGHPFIDLLNNPNPVDTYINLMGKTVKSLDAFGNAFWWLWGDENGQPTAIWHIPVSRMTVEPSTDTRVARYVYSHNGYIREFNPLEIAHFIYEDLDDDFYGGSKMVAIQNDAALDILMAQHQLDFFGNNNASPSGLLGIPQWGLTKIKEFLEDFHKKFGGGKRGVLPYEMDYEGKHAVFQRTGATQQEMEFVESRKATRQIILDRMGLPVATLSENVTEANARVGERFLARNVWFRLQRIASRINKDIILPFYGDTYIFAFEDIRHLEAEQLLRRRQASENVLTIDEQRDWLFGREPLDNKENTDDASHSNAT